MTEAPRKLSSGSVEFRELMDRGYIAKVTLDGEEVTGCVEYDLDAQTVTIVVTDENKNYVIEGDEFKYETRSGLVTATLVQSC